MFQCGVDNPVRAAPARSQLSILFHMKQSIIFWTSSTTDAHILEFNNSYKYLDVKTEVFNNKKPIIVDGDSYVMNEESHPIILRGTIRHTIRDLGAKVLWLF